MSQYNQAPAPAAQKPKFSVAINTRGYQNLINSTLGDPERARRFTASITSAVAVNPALQECEASTILAGALLGESLNLSPSPQLGHYYLVPFNNKKKGTKEAQFILGYHGYTQLALRSGQYTDLDVMDIREGEYLGKDADTGKPRFKFIEDDDIRDQLPVVGYMAYFQYSNGFRKVLYWSKEKMMNHADKYSPAFSRIGYERLQRGEVPQSEMWKYSSFWYKNFDDMAKKTMLRQIISKWGIMSIDMVSAFEHDNTTVKMDKPGEFISAAPETPAVEQGQKPEAAIEPPPNAGAGFKTPETFREIEQVDLSSL